MKTHGTNSKNSTLRYCQVRALAAQEQYAALLGSFFSPKVALSDLGEKLSGTDSASLRNHVTSIENFRRDWMYRLNDADAHRRAKHRATKIETNSPEHTPWADFPAFSHHPPTLASLGPDALLTLAKLWGWAALSILAAVVCIRIRSGANRVVV